MATQFPKTLASSAPPEYVDPYAAQIAQMQAALARERAPMYSPQEQEARRTDNDTQYMLGLLGQLSGSETLGNVGGQIFKQALSQRAPRVTERGVADPITGEFKYNTEFLRERDEASLAALQRASAEARGKWDDKRLSAQERDERQREHDRVMAAIRANSGGQVGNFTPYGVGPNGENVVLNSRNGAPYSVKFGADGQPQYTPFSGQVTPKATFEKSVTSAAESLQSAQRADRLLKRVEADPDAFGMLAAGTAAFPGWAQGYAAKVAGLTPKQMETRAQLIREAAQEINILYGAALSAGENARAATFMPDAKDGPDAIIAKLRSAREWAASNARMQGPAAVNAATGRTGGATGGWDSGGAAAAPGAPLSQEDQAELAALRQRFGKKPGG